MLHRPSNTIKSLTTTRMMRALVYANASATRAQWLPSAEYTVMTKVKAQQARQGRGRDDCTGARVSPRRW